MEKLEEKHDNMKNNYDDFDEEDLDQQPTKNDEVVDISKNYEVLPEPQS